MNRLLQILITLLIGSSVYAQSVSKQVIGSAGQSISNGTYTLNFTAGEPIIGYIQNTDAIEQGFWSQLASDSTLSVETINTSLEEIKVFPNPTVSLLQIRFKQFEASNYKAKLFDVNGKEIFNLNPISQGQITTFNIAHLATGMYLLNVTDTKSNYNKTFKILKQ